MHVGKVTNPLPTGSFSSVRRVPCRSLAVSSHSEQSDSAARSVACASAVAQASQVVLSEVTSDICEVRGPTDVPRVHRNHRRTHDGSAAAGAAATARQQQQQHQHQQQQHLQLQRPQQKLQRTTRAPAGSTQGTNAASAACTSHAAPVGAVQLHAWRTDAEEETHLWRLPPHHRLARQQQQQQQDTVDFPNHHHVPDHHSASRSSSNGNGGSRSRWMDLPPSNGNGVVPHLLPIHDASSQLATPGHTATAEPLAPSPFLGGEAGDEGGSSSSSSSTAQHALQAVQAPSWEAVLHSVEQQPAALEQQQLEEEAEAVQPRGRHHSSSSSSSGASGWTSFEQRQGWRYDAAAGTAHTTDGTLLMRVSGQGSLLGLSRAVAVQLLEQQRLVLSAAGDLCALKALQALAQLPAVLLQQDLEQGRDKQCADEQQQQQEEQQQRAEARQQLPHTQQQQQPQALCFRVQLDMRRNANPRLYGQLLVYNFQVQLVAQQELQQLQPQQWLQQEQQMQPPPPQQQQRLPLPVHHPVRGLGDGPAASRALAAAEGAEQLLGSSYHANGAAIDGKGTWSLQSAAAAEAHAPATSSSSSSTRSSSSSSSRESSSSSNGDHLGTKQLRAATHNPLSPLQQVAAARRAAATAAAAAVTAAASAPVPLEALPVAAESKAGSAEFFANGFAGAAFAAAAMATHGSSHSGNNGTSWSQQHQPPPPPQQQQQQGCEYYQHHHHQQQQHHWGLEQQQGEEELEQVERQVALSGYRPALQQSGPGRPGSSRGSSSVSLHRQQQHHHQGQQLLDQWRHEQPVQTLMPLHAGGVRHSQQQQRRPQQHHARGASLSPFVYVAPPSQPAAPAAVPAAAAEEEHLLGLPPSEVAIEVAASGAALDAVQVALCSDPFLMASRLQQTLAAAGRVRVDVAYRKHAGQLLQAVAMLQRRLDQQQGQQQQQQQQLGGRGAPRPAGTGVCIQCFAGSVERQSGMKPGVHVVLYLV